MTFSPKATLPAREKAVLRLIADLRADTRPILIGPWRSELGFEGLYWLPFLTWLAKQVRGFDQRAAVVTRGGLAPLYANVAAQGCDLYLLREVKDLRRQNLADQQATGLQKQLAVTPFDDAVLDDAAQRLGMGLSYHTVHPAWMYWLLGPYWDETAGLRHLARYTEYSPLVKPLAEIAGLPEHFMAVKFYSRATFPYPYPEVGAFVQETIARIAAQVPVVMLKSSPEYDDHADIDVAGPNILHLQPAAPTENLLVQLQVLAKSDGFVGTYGGLAQVALRMGKPSASFYHTWGGTAHAHLSLSSWISKQSKVPFLVSSLADVNNWRNVVLDPKGLAAPAVAA